MNYISNHTPLTPHLLSPAPAANSPPTPPGPPPRIAHPVPRGRPAAVGHRSAIRGRWLHKFLGNFAGISQWILCISFVLVWFFPNGSDHPTDRKCHHFFGRISMNFNGFPVFLRNFSYFKIFKDHFTYRNCLVTRVCLAIFKWVNPTKQKLSNQGYQPLTKWDDPTSKIGVGHDLAIIFRGTIEINLGYVSAIWMVI